MERLMFGWDFEDEIWSRFVFELVIWPKEVTLARWTQPSGPLCLWQCLYSCGFKSSSSLFLTVRESFQVGLEILSAYNVPPPPTHSFRHNCFAKEYQRILQAIKNRALEGKQTLGLINKIWTGTLSLTNSYKQVWNDFSEHFTFS